MYIKTIKLENFRNLNKEIIEFSEDCNIIIGDNAQGKTNIIEAIYLCSRGKSFRSKDSNLIKREEKKAKIIIEFYKNNRNQQIEIEIFNNKKKTILINGVKISKYTELFGVLNIVFFSPDDLSIIKNGPAERRKFIDREIASVDKNYLRNLIYYYKIISQRNKLIKNQNRELNLIAVYNEQLALYAEKLIKKRQHYIKKIENYAGEIHKKLSNNKENLTITYKQTIENNKQNIIKQLEDNLEQDIKYGYTRIGPHKDDFIININNQNSRIFASQGQQRTAALSLKLSEIKLFESEMQQKPILLLDDVMSELDSQRQTMIIKEIKNIQTILTTTDLHGLDIKQLKPFYEIIIENGKILFSEEYLCQK